MCGPSESLTAAEFIFRPIILWLVKYLASHLSLFTVEYTDTKYSCLNGYNITVHVVCMCRVV